jgi:sn-glycerol 3-phosphate transport system permease protein
VRAETSYRLRSSLLAYALVAPALLALGVFVLYPAALSFYLSFHDMEPFSKTLIPTGWDHYAELLSSADYWNSLHASALFVLYTVPASVVLSLAAAVALDARPFVHGAFRTIFLLPVGVSPAMAAMLWVFLYNPSAGYLSYLVTSVGLTSPGWLTDPAWALPAVALTTVWKEIGFNVIFFLAGLAGVPADLHDAARVDGAGPLSRFRHVTLPMISPTLLFVATVSVIHAFESFGQIHVLTRGGPAKATSVLVYAIYREAFENFRIGFASAQAVLLFLVILAVTALQLVLTRRRVHYG